MAYDLTQLMDDDFCNYWALVIWSKTQFQYNLLDFFEMPIMEMLWNPTLEAMLPVTVQYIEPGRSVKAERLGKILKCGGEKVYLNCYIFSIIQ